MRWLGWLGIASFVTLACGGATEQDVLSTSPSGGAGTTSSTSSSGGSSTSSSGGSTTSSSSSGGSSGDPSVVKDGGGACPQEDEPNNEPKLANKLNTSLCGVLSPGTENEYLTFELPQGTKTMNLTFEGDIEMRVIVEGHYPVMISPASNPPIPFVVGKPYYIEVTAFKGGDKIPWRVNLNRT